jgi:uncharacterized protein (DUF488 family)
MYHDLISITTIGSNQNSAKDFFENLKAAGVKRIIDVRLHNTSQLTGFTKRNDLEYFLAQILQAEYIHEPLLAPTQELFEAYKKERLPWEKYKPAFLHLLEERRIEANIDPKLLVGGCLLCSEHEPHYCHRTLVVEYLQSHWGNITVNHLV